jgi:hypothetical protein
MCRVQGRRTLPAPLAVSAGTRLAHLSRGFRVCTLTVQVPVLNTLKATSAILAGLMAAAMVAGMLASNQATPAHYKSELASYQKLQMLDHLDPVCPWPFPCPFLCLCLHLCFMSVFVSLF